MTGATGFVGRRLVPALVDAGHDVLAMTRRPEEYTGAGAVVGGDVEDPDSLAVALEGVEIAYYLVHALDHADFEARDAASARGFAEAAEAAGVSQIVYLGGLGGDDLDALSAHLRSRREVEALLAATSVPVTVLRAAVVVGRGGTSWEMTREVVERLPLLVVPRAAATLTQPIGLDDAVAYLVGVAGEPRALGRAFDIGGADVLTYAEMLSEAALVRHGREFPVLPVRGLPRALAALGMPLVASVDPTTGRHLLDSMDVEVVVVDPAIRDVVPLEPVGYREAVRRATEEERQAGLAD